jgi:hypothetical protein
MPMPTNRIDLAHRVRVSLCAAGLALAGVGVGIAGMPGAAEPPSGAPAARSAATAPATGSPAAEGSAEPAAAAPPETGASAMSGHMYMTSLRAKRPGDEERAGAIVAAAKQAMAPYQDYHKAIEDGFEVFLPNIPQPQYHFTKAANGRAARTHFDPLKPTSLLYKKAADGGYQLVGVMYTDRVSASQDEIDQRVPLSIARWHQHVNFCVAPLGHRAEYFGPHAKFGLNGSIDTKEACNAAGGLFLPHVLGWMVHVYPYEKDPAKVWSAMDDGDGHDNMDHSSMPDMKMD